MSYRASDGTRQWDGSKKVPTRGFHWNDASHQRICPYCHNAYDMKAQNWGITRIEK